MVVVQNIVIDIFHDTLEREGYDVAIMPTLNFLILPLISLNKISLATILIGWSSGTRGLSVLIVLFFLEVVFLPVFIE